MSEEAASPPTSAARCHVGAPDLKAQRFFKEPEELEWRSPSALQGLTRTLPAPSTERQGLTSARTTGRIISSCSPNRRLGLPRRSLHRHQGWQDDRAAGVGRHLVQSGPDQRSAQHHWLQLTEQPPVRLVDSTRHEMTCPTGALTVHADRPRDIGKEQADEFTIGGVTTCL